MGDVVFRHAGGTLEHVLAPTPDAGTLIDELESELSALYKPEQRHGLAVDALFQPNIRFFIARRKGEMLGCGGVAFFSDFAEVKRMYVRKPYRGSGVADAIMARLIAEARIAGYSRIRVETGIHSHAAVGFYARHGFRACLPFEPYTSLAAENIVTSAFMEKQLTRDRALA